VRPRTRGSTAPNRTPDRRSSTGRRSEYHENENRPSPSALVVRCRIGVVWASATNGKTDFCEADDGFDAVPPATAEPWSCRRHGMALKFRKARSVGLHRIRIWHKQPYAYGKTRRWSHVKIQSRTDGQMVRRQRAQIQYSQTVLAFTDPRSRI